MLAPTCFGINCHLKSVPSAFWEMINWGAVDRILWMGVLHLVTWCTHLILYVKERNIWRIEAAYMYLFRVAVQCEWRDDGLNNVHLPMRVLRFRIGNQLPSAATLCPRRTDTKTIDAAAVDAAWLTQTTYERGLSSDVTFFAPHFHTEKVNDP
jgi:hypothetical protein